MGHGSIDVVAPCHLFYFLNTQISYHELATLALYEEFIDGTFFLALFPSVEPIPLTASCEFFLHSNLNPRCLPLLSISLGVLNCYYTIYANLNSDAYTSQFNSLKSLSVRCQLSIHGLFYFILAVCANFATIGTDQQANP